MKRLVYCFIALCCLFGCLVGAAAAYADERDDQLLAVQNGFASRAQDIMDFHLDTPFPNIDSPNPLGYASYALAALYKNQDTVNANSLIAYFKNNWIVPLDDQQGEDIVVFWAMGELIRSWYTYYPSSMNNPDADTAIKNMFFNYIYKRSEVAKAHPAEVWNQYLSENLEVANLSYYLLGARMLLTDPNYSSLPLYDGHSIQEHYDAWCEYMKLYFKEHAQKGSLVEQGSPTYAKYTIASLLNIRDFAGNPEVGAMASSFLDLIWADYAQEALNGVKGGAKTRAYKDEASWNANVDSYTGLAQLYFGLPESVGLAGHPSFMIAAASTYRVPLKIMDLVLFGPDKGSYAYVSTRPAEGFAITEEKFSSYLFPSNLRRNTYTTPSYITGAYTIDRTHSYTATASQNRWMGTIFSGSPSSRVYASVKGLRNAGTVAVADLNGVAEGDSMIVQKLPEVIEGTDMRVFFSLDMNREDDNGWAFASDPGGTGYIGVKPASGTYSWSEEVAPEKADKDTYVENGAAANSNFGVSSELKVKNDAASGNIAYLILNIGNSLPADQTTSNAKLKLYVNNKSAGNVTMSVYGITDTAWLESTTTWNSGSPNHAASGYSITGAGNALDTVTISTYGTAYEFDVTDYINGQLGNGIRKVAFLLAGETPGEWVSIQSSEKPDGTGNAPNQPLLNITAGRWITMSDPYSPVVMQTGLASDYTSFADFKTQVKGSTFRWNTANEFEFQAPGGANLKYYTSMDPTTSQLPKINNAAVDLTPAKTYSSPFIDANYNSPVITVTDTRSQSLALDFNYDNVRSYTAIEDSFVTNGADSNQNYGALNVVRAKYSYLVSGRMGYFKFNANDFPEGAAEHADLQLYTDGGTSATTVKVYLITDNSWDEDTMTWNTGSPNHGITSYDITGIDQTAFLADEKIIAGSTSQAYTFDVTEQVNAQLQNGVKVFSFLVVGTANDNVIVPFYSKEAATNKPKLKLTPLAPSNGVALDKAALGVEYAVGEGPTAITQNLTLPKKGRNGSTIIWSSVPARIAPDGTVTRPGWSDSEDVVLTALIKYGDVTDTKTFPMKVLRQDFDLYPTSEDAYIAIGDKDKNFGWAESVPTKYGATSGRMGYFKFDADNYMGSQAAKAELQLSAKGGATDAQVQVYLITDNNWDEDTMTWNTGSPNHGSTTYTVTGTGTTAYLAGSVTVPGSVNPVSQYYTFDVTSLVNMQLLNNVKTFSFMTVANTPGSSVVVAVYSKEAKVNPPLLKLVTAEGAVAMDKTALAIGYAGGDTPTSITQNVTLPTSGLNGSTIAWSSSVPGVIATNGTVTRPAVTSADTDVVLTATISQGAESDTKIFTLKVLKMTFQPFQANEDAHIMNGTSSNSNFGSATRVLSKYSNSISGRMGYFKFDAGDFAGSAAELAELKLYAEGASADMPVKLYLITDNSWDEDTMTWNTGSPNHGTNYEVTGIGVTAFETATATISGSTSQLYTFDVTDEVNQQLASSVKVFSFLVVALNTTSPDIVHFYSKESSDHKPLLELTPQF